MMSADENSHLLEKTHHRKKIKRKFIGIQMICPYQKLNVILSFYFPKKANLTIVDFYRSKNSSEAFQIGDYLRLETLQNKAMFLECMEKATYEEYPEIVRLALNRLGPYCKREVIQNGFLNACWYGNYEMVLLLLDRVKSLTMINQGIEYALKTDHFNFKIISFLFQEKSILKTKYNL